MNNFFNNKDINIFYISLFFFFLSNEYFSFSESLHYGAADGYFYIIIAENFPEFPEEEISYHYVQRFLVPYFIGFLSKIFFLNTFLMFRIITVLLILCILVLFIKINKRLEIKPEIIFISSSILVLHPYLFRFYLATSTIIIDLFFILSFLGIIISVIDKNRINLYLFIFIGLISRQTSVAFLIAILFIFILKKNKFLKYKDFFFILLISFFALIMINRLASNMFISKAFPYQAITGIIHYLFINFNLINFIIFIFFSVFGFFSVMIYYFLFKKQKDNFLYNEINIFILISSIIIILQPIMGGPIVSGKNIIRLAILCLPAMLIIINSQVEYKFNLTKKIFIIFLFLFSLHPTFSNIKYFLKLFVSL
jgi:hypothetical protein